MKPKGLPLLPDGTIDFANINFPIIDFSKVKGEYIEPSEEEKQKLDKYNREIEALRNKKRKS